MRTVKCLLRYELHPCGSGFALCCLLHLGAITLNQLPNTLEELEDAIVETKARADCHYQTDASVIEQYDARCNQVQAMTPVFLA